MLPEALLEQNWIYQKKLERCSRGKGNRANSLSKTACTVCTLCTVCLNSGSSLSSYWWHTGYLFYCLFRWGKSSDFCGDPATKGLVHDTDTEGPPSRSKGPISPRNTRPVSLFPKSWVLAFSFLFLLEELASTIWPFTTHRTKMNTCRHSRRNLRSLPVKARREHVSFMYPEPCTM